MGILLGAGAITSVLLLVPVITGPVGASIDGSHIAYSADLSYSVPLGGSYIAVTCGALVLSSSRLLEVFGVVNFGVAIGLAWLTFTGLTSALVCVCGYHEHRDRDLPAPYAADGEGRESRSMS